jgi:hypothetical protein
MRALSNAARMASENPALLRLRELEVARGFSANAGNTIVMGLDSGATALRNGKAGNASVVTSEDEAE